MDKQTAALEALKKMDCLTITPEQAAAVIGCSPQYIRLTARVAPDALGFPAIVYGKPTRRNPRGSRVKIMRDPFIRFVEGGRK